MEENTKYIFSKGDLLVKDSSILLKVNNKNNYIPIKNIKELYCFSELSITTKLLEILSKSNIVLHFFNYYGNYVGTFVPKEHYFSGSLLIKQVELFQDKRVIIAKNIVLGIANNIHTVLFHYYKHGKTELKNYLNWLKKEVPIVLNKNLTIEQIMALEGHIWDNFYKTFSVILPKEFILNKRVRRPPDNPINALISFGNTLLYTKTISQLSETHINQSISFLHEPMEKRFSLALDLSEVFKPIIVFKTIFDCVNTKKITVEEHFEKKYNYVLLNEIGKKIFINEFESRMNATFKHSKLKRNISYKTAIKLESYKLIKYAMENKEFVPFNMELKQ